MTKYRIEFVRSMISTDSKARSFLRGFGFKVERTETIRGGVIVAFASHDDGDFAEGLLGDELAIQTYEEQETP